MEYHEAVNTLEGLRRLRPKLGTETTASLLSVLEDPHEELTAVQIAGSNGKGSTARILARILREAGLTVGLYTSPDLNDVRERVRVCGRKIPRHRVVEYVETVWPFVVDRTVEGDGPTFFEVVTGMALWHFAREDVDVAVLEVGIGGRYDATSVVDPVAAAVTTVDLEHTDILGETVEEIARDKAHVAPADRPLVTGATGAALETLRADSAVLTVGPGEDADVRARELGMVSTTESSVTLSGPDWRVESNTSLLGQHQAVNAGIAAALARQVADVTEAPMAAGLGNVHWPGRFEIMDEDPLVVLDGAHNPGACATLSILLERYDYDGMHLVFGAMRDKDHPGMVRALPAGEVYLAAPAVDRAQDTDTLAAVFRRAGADPDQFDSVLGALEVALARAGADDCVLVAGSLYTVGEARDRFTRTPTTVRTPTLADARAVMARADVPAAKRDERAADGVHRTVTVHVRRDVAADLQEAMLSVGGSCTVSGIEAAHQHVRVVLAGTLAQFDRLVGTLRGRTDERRYLADQLAGALDSGDPPDRSTCPWSEGTALMGILDVTDAGGEDPVAGTLARGERMAAAGADVVDVRAGRMWTDGESVPAAAERDRVLDVVEALDVEAMVSVETRRPAVAAAALDAGVDMVNDISGLADAEMRRAIAEHSAPVVLRHSLASPVDPDRHPYDDVVDDVIEDLRERLLLADRAGIDRSQVVVDPGLCFGKRPAESFELLERLDEVRALGSPVLVDHSRGAMFEEVVGDADDRLVPTVAATALAAERGVSLVRVHDVPENAAAIRTAHAALDGP